MSRIGKLPVHIPEKVKASVTGNTISVEGPKGKLAHSFDRAVRIEIEDGIISVSPENSSRHAKAMHGTARSIINNMVEGVTNGFSRSLEIHGVGFKAAAASGQIDLSLGYSHPIKHPIPDGVSVVVTDNTKIKIEGADKQAVGALAAQIKSYYPVEPYKGKGVRIVGEYVRRKEGKKSAK
ncbi:MAG: 50S ribosomal protein L6 [Puniceicoccaceae bacterium]